MLKISFSTLQSKYPRRVTVPTNELYASIGLPHLAKDMNWDNTCAVRVSLALIGAGVQVPGHMTIKAGPYKGRTFQPGQSKLSKYLAQPWVLGVPEKFRASRDALLGVRGRSGIISFFNNGGASDPQGHIDIVSPDDFNDPTCGNACYWSAVEIWFCPLK